MSFLFNIPVLFVLQVLLYPGEFLLFLLHVHQSLALLHLLLDLALILQLIGDELLVGLLLLLENLLWVFGDTLSCGDAASASTLLSAFEVHLGFEVPEVLILLLSPLLFVLHFLLLMQLGL